MATYTLTLSFPIRRGTLDVESKTITRALHSMNYQNILNVRMARAIAMEFSCRTNKAAKALSLNVIGALAHTPSGYNPILHDLECELWKDNKVVWKHQVVTALKSFV